MRLLDEWNKQPFSIYTSEERGVLGLLKRLGVWVGKVIQQLDILDKLSNDNKNKKVSYDDMREMYNFYKDLESGKQDYRGSWHGIPRPEYAEPGIQGQVTANREDIEHFKNVKVDVTFFGAKGDGITDDRIAIKNALKYLEEHGGGELIFPNGEYAIKSCDEEYSTDGIIINCNNITIKGYGKAKIKAYVEIEDLVKLPKRVDNFIMDNMIIDGNNLSNYCINGSYEYCPYQFMKKCTFTKAKECNFIMATFVAQYDSCNFLNGKNGVYFKPISGNVNTSITMNSCYVNQMNGEFGYKFGTTTYSTLNSCACDNMPNGVAYVLNVRGFTLNACGSEKVMQIMKCESFRGISLNSFFGLSCGSDETDYLFDFVTGQNCVINGVQLEKTVGSGYILGLTTKNYGYENITILDNSIPKNKIYFVPNFNYTNPIKLIRGDETTKDISVHTTIDKLRETFDNLPNTINHKVTILIDESNFVLDNYITLNGKKGNGSIIIDMQNTKILPTQKPYALTLINNSVNMVIKNGTLSQTSASNNGEICRVINSKLIAFINVTFANESGGKGGSAISARDGSIVKIKDSSATGTFGSDSAFTKIYNDGLSIIDGTLS